MDQTLRYLKNHVFENHKTIKPHNLMKSNEIVSIGT